MLVDDKQILTAVHWWCAERENSKNPIPVSSRVTLGFAFKIANGLFLLVERLPDPLCDQSTLDIQQGGHNNFIIDIPVTAELFTDIRSALSLIGDLRCAVEQLGKQDMYELTPPLENLLKELERFRAIRNFFTHLDERLTDFTKHGICGPADTGCGVKYVDTAKDCFHLILRDNTVYFSEKKSAEAIDVGRQSLSLVFPYMRDIYRELTSHDIHRDTCAYSEPEQIFN